jgi:hypothetical protein
MRVSAPQVAESMRLAAPEATEPMRIPDAERPAARLVRARSLMSKSLMWRRWRLARAVWDVARSRSLSRGAAHHLDLGGGGNGKHHAQQR